MKPAALVPFQPALRHHYGLGSADLIDMPFDERQAFLEDLIRREQQEAMEVK